MGFLLAGDGRKEGRPLQFEVFKLDRLFLQI